MLTTPILEPPETEQQKTITINFSYPSNSDFYYETSIERINLDKEKVNDVYNNKGFIISKPNNIKKDLKDPEGIFSPKFGQGLSDQNPYIDRYSCECGDTKSAINKDTICPHCGTKVKYIGDKYDYFGWIQLYNHYIIHPNIYSSLEFFFGPGGGNNKKDKDNKHANTKLYNMIKYAGIVDQDGKEGELRPEDIPSDQPFYGIGMIDFYNRFDEIMEYYRNKYPKKEDYYNNIMSNRDKVFTQSIPVFTTHLRPHEIRSDLKDQSLYFEPINAMYNMLNHLAFEINKNSTIMNKKLKPKNNLLFDMQMEYQKLYDEVIDILAGKKGWLRQLTGGRFNFSSRAVIAQDPTLRVDQIKLPYKTLAIILQQKIINILGRIYHITPSQAYNIWSKGLAKYDEEIATIIQSIINSTEQGIPFLINRNRATRWILKRYPLRELIF